ncbi:MAG: DoxX family protein [Candidatus Pacebacteria bacterium]|nr:DoxX family protein [Candidatus Paceibacterota bacterium]
MKKINNPSWFGLDAGLLLVRLSVAMIFLFAGIGKLMMITMVAGFFTSMGLPAWVAWLVAIVETLGGIAMLLGIYTRFFGIGLAIIMTVAYFMVHMAQGFTDSQMVIVLFLVNLAIVAMGPGKYALKRKTAVQSAPVL